MQLIHYVRSRNEEYFSKYKEYKKLAKKKKRKFHCKGLMHYKKCTEYTNMWTLLKNSSNTPSQKMSNKSRFSV